MSMRLEPWHVTDFHHSSKTGHRLLLGPHADVQHRYDPATQQTYSDGDISISD